MGTTKKEIWVYLELPLALELDIKIFFANNCGTFTPL